jgi:conjugal transfer pilus assembly protein TraE
MDTRRYQSDLDQARASARQWRRTAALVIAGNLLLAVRVLTLDTREKTIITPPVVSEAFWVKGSQVSPSYLETMARYFANLALTFSPSSMAGQKDVLLRYADPSAHGALDAKLTEDADRVQHQKISEVFYPARTRIRTETLEVALSGDLVTFVGAQQTGVAHTTYVIRFINRDGQLFVAAFTEASNESDPFGDRSAPAADHTAGG